jgi:oxygen-independent coproporphyrinogen-3 oxidase
MEIDPRTVEAGDLEFYASFGITRISFGVQDFDPHVQKAINREQPASMVEALLRERHLFKGVNFDLLYGLPKQTHETIAETVRLTKWLSPERITLLKYCHAPELRRHMKLINVSDLPSPDELPLMFLDITENLTESGYQWIGIDHFAKLTDDLAVAAQRGTLNRNFNGFIPGRTKDLIGIGPTSTGAFGDTYSQSIYELPAYYKAVSEGRFPVLRGYRMTKDDLLRREVIFSLLCRQEVDLNKYNGYFERERKLLQGIPELVLSRDGLIRVTKWGRVLLRSICKVFDVKDVKPEHMKIAQLSMTRRVA